MSSYSSPSEFLWRHNFISVLNNNCSKIVGASFICTLNNYYQHSDHSHSIALKKGKTRELSIQVGQIFFLNSANLYASTVKVNFLYGEMRTELGFSVTVTLGGSDVKQRIFIVTVKYTGVSVGLLLFQRLITLLHKMASRTL